jgi:periplasmic divalent cation tolerance protein
VQAPAEHARASHCPQLAAGSFNRLTEFIFPAESNYLMNEIIVLMTTPSKEEGERIGRILVEKKLAACANILSPILSIFSWEGKVCQEQESLVILKTRRDCFAPLAEEVKKQHTYSVPEIIALPLTEGSSEYLKWVRENTQPS